MAMMERANQMDEVEYNLLNSRMGQILSRPGQEVKQ